ncbi:Sec1 protein [Martiniozyma asiatica (nom. inval.)]|nr:Sec1 protein [Martiniozyma asiatica]
MNTTDQSALLVLQKEAFKKEISHLPKPCHLIVDNTTERLIKVLFKDEILNLFYTFSMIDSPDRSKDKNQHAIYLLDPYRSYSIDCLSADYSFGLRYNTATVMFLPGAWQKPWAYLNSNPYFKKGIHSEKPLISYSLGFITVEPHLFITGAYPSIPAYYSNLPEKEIYKQYQIERSINAMVSICVLFNEFPVIRYYNSPLSSHLAKEVQKRLIDYARANVNFAPSSDRTVFMITDRSMGMFDALCHFDYYRYFVYDFVQNMEMEPGAYPLMTYSYSAMTQAKERIENEVIFDVNDDIYMNFKDAKIPQVLEGLKKYTKEVNNESSRLAQLDELSSLQAKWKANKLTQEEKKRFEELKRIWNVSQTMHDKLKIEKHNVFKSLVNGHINFCNEIKDTKKLTMMREFESMCALFIASPKQTSSFMPPTEALLHCLSALGEDDTFDKLRLILIYALYRGGIIRQDMNKLLNFAIPNNVEKIMKNLEKFERMGIKIFKDDLKQSSIPKTFFTTDSSALNNPIDSYIPSYSNIVEKLANRTLPEAYTTKKGEVNGYEVEIDVSKKTFPYANAGEIPVDDNLSYNFESKLKFSSTGRQRPRMFIFAAGGLTASELSMIGSMEKKVNHDIYVGTDQIYSVLEMIGDINEMDDDLKFELAEKKIQKKAPEYLFEATSASKTIPQESKHHLNILHHHKIEPNNAAEDGKVKKSKGLFGKLKRKKKD